jgi:transposase
VDGHR